MEHATYLRQLFPTLTLFGVMVFSGASCTGTSKLNVVQENNPKCPSRPLSKIDGKNGEEKSDTDQKGEGGSGRPHASTPNPPVASPPVVEPNNPAGLPVPQRDACVNQLLDALDSEEFERKFSSQDRQLIRSLIIHDRYIADEFVSSGESAIEYCDKILKNVKEVAQGK